MNRTVTETLARLAGVVIVSIGVGAYVEARDAGWIDAGRTVATRATDGDYWALGIHAAWLADQGTWRSMTLDEVIMIAPGTGREDWTGCEIRYGDTTAVRCPDGYRLES